MNTDMLGQLTYEALVLVLILSLPPVGVAAAVGLLVAIVQTVTQVQDQSIGQAIKIISVMITLLVMSGWMAAAIKNFALKLFSILGMGWG
jgi:type III secretion protein S